MLLPIKLATGKQPAKKQKVQKDLGLVITPEMQKNIEATNPQGIVERAKQIEAVRAEQEQFAQRTKQSQAQLAYEQTLKQAAQQPTQAKAFVPKLQELEKQISPPSVSREVVMQKRVPKTPEGLATINILTDYGTTTYTATPEETQILEFGTIDEGAALRNRLRQEAQTEFANQGLKKKRQTAEAYVTDKVNAALNPNFVNDQVAETLRAELDDTIFDFAAKYSPGGKLLKTGRDVLKSASTKLKSVDDIGAQVTAGLIDSIINPVSSFATATANVYDPTATEEERAGAAGNIALYVLGALPVTEALGASIRAFKTGADVAEGLSLAARSLLKSTAPGRFIDRKVTINDLVNVLERNGQMGGKTRGQLAREFASGGKAFAKATGQAPELFYNKYLNDLADQAQPATPAQFDVTAPKASKTPTQVEDLGTVVDDLVGKTEPVVAPTPEPAPVVESPVTPPTSIVDEIEQGMGASKSTASPPPIEPTVTGTPETPDEQLTSAKNRMTQEVRDEYDMGKFDEPTRRKWEESLTTAKQELQSNTNAVDNVIAKIDSKRAINEAEQSVLVVALSRERRNARMLLEQTNNATSPEEIATLAEQTKIAESRIDNYTNALNRAGSETARTLNARRAVIDAAEDLVSIRAKARQTYGKALEVADEEAINEIGKGLEDINKQIDDATGKGTTPVETAKANTRVKGIKESAPVTKKSIQNKTDSKTLDNVEKKFASTKQKQIERLEKDIAVTQEQLDGQFVYETETPGKPVSPEVQALKDKLAELKKQRTQLKKDLTKTTVKSKAEILQEQIKAVQEMIRKGEIYESQPIPKTKSPEIIALEKQLAELKRVAKEISFRQGTTKPNEPLFSTVKAKLQGLTRPSTIETMGVPTEVDIWQPRLNDPASQAYFKQLASVQNDMGKVIQKLVADELIEDFDTLLTRLQADGFNITDTDLKLILSADYPTTKLYDFSDIEKEYVKMVRRQLAQEAKDSSVAERGRLIKKIQDLSQKVQAGVRKTTDKTLKTIFEENIDLQNRLDDLQAQYEGYANKLDKESQVAKARIQKDIDDLEKEIANPVLKEKLEREIPENVRQLLIERELLRRRKQQVMRKLAAEKDKRDNPSKYAMMNAFKLVNELKFGADASSLFTHGLFNAGTKESALAFKDGISAMFSEKKLSQILSEIKTNPRYQEAVDAGVAGLKERELADSVVYSNVVENVPILKSLYTPGSRFNEAFNARLRMTMYNDAANLMESRWFGAKGTKDAPTRQAIATTINNMTGAMTGKLAKSLNQNEAAREFVGVVFPTIKFLGSRFQLAFGNPALQAAMAKNPALAVYVAKKYARFGALMIGGLYGLDKVLPKDRFKIDNDPKDIKNFGKITDLQTNIVYQPFKNFLDPYKVTLGMEVMRDFMADKDENGIPIESSKPEQSFFERDETSVIANRLGTAPRAAYNLLAGIASPTYESFGKNLSIRTNEGRINTITQFAPIAGIQGAELATLKEPATQRDVDLANKLIGIVIAPSGIPISVKKDKESKARQPVTPGVIP